MTKPIVHAPPTGRTKIALVIGAATVAFVSVDDPLPGAIIFDHSVFTPDSRRGARDPSNPERWIPTFRRVPSVWFSLEPGMDATPGAP